MDNAKILFAEDNPGVGKEFEIKMINLGYSLTGTTYSMEDTSSWKLEN